MSVKTKNVLYHDKWHFYLKLSNARDTTNFTTKCLQTDMASYVKVTHQQLKHQITNSILIFNINKSINLLLSVI